jgi:glutamyl-tRNA reductase
MSKITSMLVTHKRASMDGIERAWHGNVQALNRRLLACDGVEECAILKTCNRMEVYVVTADGENTLRNFAKKIGVSERIVDFHGHEASLRHLLRLAAGLESMIIGEDQILGQMKRLYSMARDACCTGKVLDTAFNKAIQVGKKVRRETRINEGAVSIGSAAVDLAEEILWELEGKKILIVGAGELGTLVAKALAEKNVHTIYVTNRTFARTKALARESDGFAIPYEEMESHLYTSDVVICATNAPHFILRVEMMKKVMRDRETKLLVIDIASPRDVEEGVANIPNVELHNIDSLRDIGSRNTERRMEEVEKVEQIIEEELEMLKRTYKREEADQVIAKLYSKALGIRDRERERAVNRLNNRHILDENEMGIIEDLTRSITNKILTEPILMLKDAAEKEDMELLTAAAKLFGLDKQ